MCALSASLVGWIWCILSNRSSLRKVLTRYFWSGSSPQEGEAFKAVKGSNTRLWLHAFLTASNKTFFFCDVSHETSNMWLFYPCGISSLWSLFQNIFTRFGIWCSPPNRFLLNVEVHSNLCSALSEHVMLQSDQELFVSCPVCNINILTQRCL